MHQNLPTWLPRFQSSPLQPISYLQQHASRVLNVLLDLHQELDSLLAVKQTVIVSQSQVHHGPGLDLAVHNDSALLDRVKSEDRGLGEVDDGCAHERAENTPVADGEGTASHILERELSIACLGLC